MIVQPGISVLDIGCAGGDLYHGLIEKVGKLKYTGTDIAPNLIEHARNLESEANFPLGNLSTDNLIDDHQYDLVTATGVFQHEPDFSSLFRTMIQHTLPGGHILFVVKLFHSHETLRDIGLSYCAHSDPIYFIVFNLKELIARISDLQFPSIAIYGYYCGVHESVRLPETVSEKVCSAHILLRKSEYPESDSVELSLKLPGSIRSYEKSEILHKVKR
jgi:SAM-dependent methyltransferase